MALRQCSLMRTDSWIFSLVLRKSDRELKTMAYHL
jgi:hypothetical protein